MQNQPFQSIDDILSRIKGTKLQFPTLTDWVNLDNEVEKWSLFKYKLQTLNEIHRILINKVPNLPSLNELAVITNDKICDFETLQSSIFPNMDDSTILCIESFLSILSSTDGIYGEKKFCKLASGLYKTIRRNNESLSYFMTNDDWIFSNNSNDCPIKVIHPILIDWTKFYENYNFSTLVQVVRLFLGVKSPYVATIKLLVIKYIYVMDCLRYVVDKIQTLITRLNHSIVYQLRIDTKSMSLNDIVDNIVDKDFSVIECEISQKSLSTISKVIDRTPGAIEFFQTDGNCSVDDLTVTILSLWNEVFGIGHSGANMDWTSCQYQNIFQNGWKTWVYRILLSRGIGWNSIDLNDAIKYKIPDCIIYHIEKKSSALTNKLSHLKELIDLSIQNGYATLLDYLLLHFGNKLTEDDYWNYITYCNDNHKNSIVHLFHRYRTKYHP